MVQLSLLSFFALLEIIVVLLLLLGVAVWRLRRRRSAGIQFIDVGDAHPSPSLYLDRESARTRSFLDRLQGKPTAPPEDPSLRAALSARARLFRSESTLAKTAAQERDPANWTELAQSVALSLSAEGYARQAKSDQIHGEDTHDSATLAAQQAHTIEYLRGYIEQLLGKLGQQSKADREIPDRLDELERVNKELQLCVNVLEDENSFLRDQIAALLALDNDVELVPIAGTENRAVKP